MHYSTLKNGRHFALKLMEVLSTGPPVYVVLSQAVVGFMFTGLYKMLSTGSQGRVLAVKEMLQIELWRPCIFVKFTVCPGMARPDEATKTRHSTHQHAAQEGGNCCWENCRGLFKIRALRSLPGYESILGFGYEDFRL